jgi:hypothetical protein
MLACIVVGFALSVVAHTPADSGLDEEFLNGRVRVVILVLPRFDAHQDKLAS